MSCITYDEFTDACSEFLAKSQELGDSWKANGDASIMGNFFLSKKQCTSDSPKNILQQTVDMTLEEENPCDSFDPCCIEDNPQRGMITYEYHITYSLSHSVPVLYFNAYDASGHLLALEELWNRIPALYSEQVMHNKWESLTQQEHPVLGRPFFQLHPCKTMIVMSQLMSNNDDLLSHKGWIYIASWLSMFGQIVGLDVSLSYFSLHPS